MPSFYRPQAFIVARYRLHTQILPSLWSGNCLTIENGCRSSLGWPIVRDQIQEGTVSALHRLGPALILPLIFFRYRLHT